MSNTFKFIEVSTNDGETGILLEHNLNLVNRKQALEYIEKLFATYNNHLLISLSNLKITRLRLL